MALTPTYLAESHNGWNGTLINTTCTLAIGAPGANTLIVVELAVIHSITDPLGAATLSGGGLTWTKIISTATSEAYSAVSAAFYAVTTTDPGAFTITATVSSPGFADAIFKMSAVKYTEFDTGTPIGGKGVTSGGAAGSSGQGPRAVTLDAAPAAGDYVQFQDLTDDSAGAYATMDTSGGGTWTINYPASPPPTDGLDNTNNNGYVTGRTSTSVPWSDVNTGSQNWTSSQVAVVIKAAAGAATDLVIANLTVVTTEDNQTLSVGSALTIADLTVVTTAANLALTQLHVLAGVGNLTSATTMPTLSFSPLYPVPTSISSSNQILDQNGARYLMKGLSSWGFAQRATNSEITNLLQRFAARGFNVINFAFCGGTRPQDEWDAVQYENIAGDSFWQGTPFQSDLGPAFSTTDWIVSECNRLGLTAMLALFVSYGGTGIRADVEAASNTDMRTFGQRVAARYPYANIVFEVEGDDGWAASSTIGRRLDYFARGIAETRTAVPNLWFAEPYANVSDGCMGMFLNVEGTDPTGYQWLHLAANGLYWYGNDHVDQIDIEYGNAVGFSARKIAVWDSEPGYAQASQYDTGAGGNQPAGVRQRTYSNFVRGFSGMNWGHERWWPFDLLGLFPAAVPADPRDVPDAVETVQAQYAWALIDKYVADTAWAPVSTLITSGQGTANHEVAQGSSGKAAVAYFPSGTTNGSTARTIVADTTIITGTGNVRLRWYDPTAGTYATIAGSEAQNASRSLTLPSAHGDGSRDFVLVVDDPPIDLVVADLTVVTTAANLALTQVHILSVGDLASPVTVDNLALTQLHVLAGVGNLTSATTADGVTFTTNLSLTVVDLTVPTTADAPAVTSTTTLIIGNLTAAVTVDNLALSTPNALGIADMTVVVAVDNVAATTNTALVIGNLTAPTAVDGVVLTGPGTLIIGDLAVAVAVPNVILSIPGTDTIPGRARLLVVPPDFPVYLPGPRPRYLGAAPTVKDPDSTLDYPLDWGYFLATSGDGTDELASVVVDVFDEYEAPVFGELEVASGPSLSVGDGTVVRYVLLRLTGGVLGKFYAVRHRVSTVDGRIQDATRWFKIRQL